MSAESRDCRIRLLHTGGVHMFISENPTPGSCTLYWVCDSCSVQSWPVSRIRGFPTEDIWAAVDKGLAVLLGCEIIEGDDKLFQCPKCATGCEVDPGLVAEGWWDPYHPLNR